MKRPEEPNIVGVSTGTDGEHPIPADPRNEPSQVVAVIETHEDFRTPTAVMVDGNEAERGGHWIALLKAMMFGVHTERYGLPMVAGREGRILEFRWVRD